MKRSDFSKIFPKGSVLVFSLLILSILLVTSLTILSSSLLDRKASLSTGSSARSFQVADSGVEEVLYQVYKENHTTLADLAGAITGASCSGSTVSFPSAGGTSTVTFYQDETTPYAGGCTTGTDWRDKVVKIKSEGAVGSNARAVEVAVAQSGSVVYVKSSFINCGGSGTAVCPSGYKVVGGGFDAVESNGTGDGTSGCGSSVERIFESFPSQATNSWIVGEFHRSGYVYAVCLQ